MDPAEARVNQHYASYAICARLRRACSHHPRNAYIVYATNHTTSKHDHTHANEQSVSLSWQKLANGRRVSQSSPSSVFHACENPRVRTTARPIYCSERTALRARATPSVAVTGPENTRNALLRDKKPTGRDLIFTCHTPKPLHICWALHNTCQATNLCVRVLPVLDD